MDSSTLPLDLITQIFLRLPVKPLIRLKCVCKLWLSLISDPQFAIYHYDLTSSPTHRILLPSNDSFAESLDIEIDSESYPDKVYLRFPPPSHPTHSHNQPRVLGSCRGLVLLCYQTTLDLLLWNPTTGVHKRLSNTRLQHLVQRPSPLGFAYDASTDDYLLIIVAPSAGTRVCVFSFKTESWNRDYYVDAPYEDPNSTWFCDASLYNGSLHWLVFCPQRQLHLIIAFDLAQRTLSEIPLFDHLYESPLSQIYGDFSLRVIKGLLGLCCWVRDRQETDIWTMEEYRVPSSWTKCFVISTCDFSPICMTKDGGIFGFNCSGIGRLEKMHEKQELLASHYYGGSGELYDANLHSAVYRESLLPLPVSLGETMKITNSDGQEKSVATKIARRITDTLLSLSYKGWHCFSRKV